MPIIVKISDMLSKVFLKKKESDGDYLTIAEIMELLNERGFGIMIILFSLPSLFPAFLPPIPTIFAIPLSFFSVQMIMRMDAPYLPKFISKRKLKRASLQKAITKSVPYMKKVERAIKPRMPFMTTETMQRYLGVFMLIFSLTVAIPLPMTNLIPSIALIFIGVGLISRDGLAAIIGVCIGILWICALAFLFQEIMAFFDGSTPPSETVIVQQ